MDDKKKLMVLGAMGVVLLGIGAFQFAKGTGQAPPPAPEPAVSQSAPDGLLANGDKGDKPVAPQQNDLVSREGYAYRNPFKPLVDANAVPAQMTPPTQQPTRIAQNLQPIPDIDKSGFGPTAPAGGGMVVPVQPTIPGYRLAGVIMGRKPAAVFVDPQGAQHLVQVGGSLDGDTRLVSLDRDRVVISVKGEIKNLTLGGGDSSAK